MIESNLFNGPLLDENLFVIVSSAASVTLSLLGDKFDFISERLNTKLEVESLSVLFSHIGLR